MQRSIAREGRQRLPGDLSQSGTRPAATAGQWWLLDLHDRGVGPGFVAVARWAAGSGAYWAGPANPSPYALCHCLVAVDLITLAPRAAQIAVFDTEQALYQAWEHSRAAQPGPWLLAPSVEAWPVAAISDWTTVPDLPPALLSQVPA